MATTSARWFICRYGCDAARLDDLEEIKKAAVEAWSKSEPTVLEVPISRQVPSLI
jgi:benzoylformate decarboxylase